MRSTLPATRSLQRRRRTAIRHVLELHLGHQLEQLGGEMRGGAVALGGGGELAGIGLGVGDHARRRSRAAPSGLTTSAFGTRAHDHDRARTRSGRSRARIEILVDDERRRRRRQQRVAVGVGLGDRLGTDIAGGAGAVLDHDRLPPFPRQPVAEDARHHVGGAAGGKRHDDLDRARRIILRPAGRAMPPACRSSRARRQSMRQPSGH